MQLKKFTNIYSRYMKDARSRSNFYIMALVICVIMPFTARGIPAYPGLIRTHQPDGTEIAIRMTGDENSHKIFSETGEELMYDDDGWLRPVKDATRAAALTGTGERKYLISGASFPSTNSPKALVILVSFPDKWFSITNPRDYFSRMLNEEGFSDNRATGSARDFFVANSNGMFTPDFDVYGPVTMKNQMRYYGANDAYGLDMHPEEMVIEALQGLDDRVDFSQYDNDGDGQIDNVYIYYAGYGEADSSISSTIWPHSADILDYELEEDYYFDGKLLNRYGMSNEVEYSTKKVDGIGTFVHEFSHVLGLPDLYATSYTLAFTPGEYSTLDFASYNNGGRTPANYSIFERYCLGWATPRMMTTSGTYTLAPVQDSNDGIIIPTEKANEFFILENRQQKDYDTYIPGHGMLVWHIEFDQDIWDNNIVNNQRNHQYVDIIEADNTQSESSRDGDTFPGSSFKTSFTTTTVPALRSRDKKMLSVSAIRNIAESPDGIITFDAEIDMSGVEGIDSETSDGVISRDGHIVNLSGETAEIYDIAGIKIATLDPGESRRMAAGIYIVVTQSGRWRIRN